MGVFIFFTASAQSRLPGPTLVPGVFSKGFIFYISFRLATIYLSQWKGIQIHCQCLSQDRALHFQQSRRRQRFLLSHGWLCLACAPPSMLVRTITCSIESLRAVVFCSASAVSLILASSLAHTIPSLALRVKLYSLPFRHKLLIYPKNASTGPGYPGNAG